jgi:hypothetical protein
VNTRGLSLSSQLKTQFRHVCAVNRRQIHIGVESFITVNPDGQSQAEPSVKAHMIELGFLILLCAYHHLPALSQRDKIDSFGL